VLAAMPLVAAPLRKLCEEVNIVLTSVSCPFLTLPDGRRELREQTLLQSGRVAREALLQMVEEEGVVGEICGWYYSRDRLVHAPGVEMLGLAPERQQELAADRERSVIGVAGGDPDRFEAIRAAVELGLINVLVTDYLTAHRLLERGEAES